MNVRLSPSGTHLFPGSSASQDPGSSPQQGINIGAFVACSLLRFLLLAERSRRWPPPQPPSSSLLPTESPPYQTRSYVFRAPLRKPILYFRPTVFRLSSLLDCSSIHTKQGHQHTNPNLSEDCANGDPLCCFPSECSFWRQICKR